MQAMGMGPLLVDSAAESYPNCSDRSSQSGDISSESIQPADATLRQ